ncbi:MAG: glycosyltransferase family 39 protein [Holophagales bacterium]|nr:glycosyltransferase family 39 protein [Holophagales bacterium]
MRALPEKNGGLPSRRTLGALGWALLAAVAVLRLLTLAPDPWEWDELLFSAAARDGIDVRVNHPHPPGYPLFVLPARLLVLAGLGPFAATLGVAVVAGLAAVGLLALLARELGAGRKEALWAALLWAVVPAVWLHSVRPLSDSLGAAAFFLAVLLLLRCEGAPSGGRLVAAAMAAGACAAVRPHVAVALLPLAAVAAWRTFRGPGGPGRDARRRGGTRDGARGVCAGRRDLGWDRQVPRVRPRDRQVGPGVRHAAPLGDGPGLSLGPLARRPLRRAAPGNPGVGRRRGRHRARAACGPPARARLRSAAPPLGGDAQSANGTALRAAPPGRRAARGRARPDRAPGPGARSGRGRGHGSPGDRGAARRAGDRRGRAHPEPTGRRDGRAQGRAGSSRPAPSRGPGPVRPPGRARP